MNVQSLNEMGCVPFKEGINDQEFEFYGVWFMHFWSPPRKHREQKDERHFLNHWTNMATSETHVLNSPLLPNSRQNYQKDTIIWEIYAIRKRRILVLSWWASLTRGNCTVWEDGYLDEQLSWGAGNEACLRRVFKQGGLTSELPLQDIESGTSANPLEML